MKLLLTVKFHKYQALGNDYLVLELAQSESTSPALMRALCDRHFGVGSDGVLVPGPGSVSQFSVRIFNPDGSEAEKSGNGLRIFAKYLWDTRKVTDAVFSVSTKSGTVRCRVLDGGQRIDVAMGTASFDSAKIPISGPPREVIDEQIEVDRRHLRFTGVTMGNPHCVVLLDEISPDIARRLGPLLERHPSFPNRTNVQFVRIIDRKRMQIEIWERGAGYTLGSGSSSCAAGAAAVRLGLCDREITAVMPGGELSVIVSEDYSVRIIGPASKIAQGTIADELLEFVQRKD
jgi:diaminopimelate epimerase